MSFSISTFFVFLLLLLLLGGIIILIVLFRKSAKQPEKQLDKPDELAEKKAKTIQLKLFHKEKETSRQFLLPLQIQAMERLILYLERIQPQSLVKRNLPQSGNLRSFHLALLQNIREEFEHNLAQQLYVSEKTWQLISTAREELIKQINLAVSNLPENASAEQLASILLTLEISVTQKAIQEIKLEFLNL